MSTPIKPNQSLDDFINSTRMELLGDTTPLPKKSSQFDNVQSRSSTSAPVEEEGENEGFFGTLNEGLQNTRQFMQGLLPEDSPERTERMGKISEHAENDPFTKFMSFAAPGGAGLASKAGQAGIIRKSLATRMKGQKLVEFLPKIQDDIAAMGDEIYDVGANLWSASLGGMNPGQFKRFLAAIPEEKLPIFRAGMLEGLVENLANLPRLTKTAQQNLKSPAGRAMLREALSELTEDQFTKLMSLVDRGQYQRFRDMAIMVSAVYPTWRFIGAPIVKFFTGN